MRAHNARVTAESFIDRLKVTAYKQVAIDLKGYDQAFSLAVLAYMADALPPRVFRILTLELFESI